MEAGLSFLKLVHSLLSYDEKNDGPKVCAAVGTNVWGTALRVVWGVAQDGMTSQYILAGSVAPGEGTHPSTGAQVTRENRGAESRDHLDGKSFGQCALLAGDLSTAEEPLSPFGRDLCVQS